MLGGVRGTGDVLLFYQIKEIILFPNSPISPDEGDRMPLRFVGNRRCLVGRK